MYLDPEVIEIRKRNRRHRRHERIGLVVLALELLGLTLFVPTCLPVAPGAKVQPQSMNRDGANWSGRLEAISGITWALDEDCLYVP